MNRLVLIAAVTLWVLHGMAGERRPNFLVILADDYGIRDVGIEGSTFYETPHIDRLARSGVRFTQGYSACQVCSPSRASILLGKAPPRHGITDYIGAQTGEAFARERGVKCASPEYTRALPSEDVTFAEVLRDAGYRTFFAGKWHLGGKGSWPEDHGFQVNRGGWHAGTPMGGYYAPWQNPTLTNGPDGEPLNQRLADETIAFVESNAAKPFLAFLSFYAVHSPVQTTKHLWAKYRQKALGTAPVGTRFKIDRTLPVRQVQDHPVYAGLIEEMDTAIGRVLARLDALGLAENTVVFFTSDNGGVSSGDDFSSSQLPYRGGKGRQWEGGLRVPFYARVPGVARPGTACEIPVIGTDLYPTILELAGLPLRPGQHVDGLSLVPLLRGGIMPERTLYWHYPHYGNQGGEPSAVIRKGKWKLIHYWEDGRNELYDLDRDVGEQRDLAGAEAALTERLWGDLNAWLKDTGARLPRPYEGYTDAMGEENRKRAEALAAALERSHADFLKPDWQPNATWWKSLAGGGK